ALDDNRKMLFDRLRDFSGYHNPISEASTIVEGIMDLVADWKNVELFRRERRWEGRRKIDALEEVQLVLECILSKGWENRGKEWKSGKISAALEQRSRYSTQSCRLSVSQFGPSSANGLSGMGLRGRRIPGSASHGSCRPVVFKFMKDRSSPEYGTSGFTGRLLAQRRHAPQTPQASACENRACAAAFASNLESVTNAEPSLRIACGTTQRTGGV